MFRQSKPGGEPLQIEGVVNGTPIPISGSISGGNAAAGPTGSPVPADADYTGFQDGSGNLIGVSAANPLPVTGGGGTIGAAVPSTGSYSGFNLAGNLVGVSASNPLPVTGGGGPTGAPVPANASYIAYNNGGNLQGVDSGSFPLPVVINGAVADLVVAQSPASNPWIVSGIVAIDQTTPGATNAVEVLNGSGGSAVNVQDGGNSITVDGTLALSAGSAVIGHVIADSGSTTAVTGNVTVVQGTGTNLHAVIDSGTITTVSTVTSVTAIANALPAGSNVIGHVVADSGSTTAVTQATATNLKAQAESYQGGTAVSVSNPLFSTPTPGTTGGWSILNATSGDGSTALTNSAQVIKGSQGTLGGWYIYNPNAVACYVPIYNVAAASVTVGTTNPAMILTIPATSAANLELTNGLQFGTAMSVAAVMTTAGGNTAPTTALEANFWWK